MKREILDTAAAASQPTGAALQPGPSRPLPKLQLLVDEMRPRQWSKNMLLFAALIFSKNLLDVAMVSRSIGAFLVFCLLSGVVYTVNDLMDLQEDRIHELKRHRPLASGALPVRLAVLWLLGVSSFALLAAGLMGWRFLVFNLGYSRFFKHMVIIDVISIAISFIIRAMAGVVALNTLGGHLTISPWLLVVTFFLSLFLGLCKRRHEYVSMQEAGKHRVTLVAYSEELLNQLINMAATATLIAYSIYTIWPDTVQHFGTDRLLFTIPFVVAGVTRYMFLVYRRDLGGDPSEVLLTERSLWLTIGAWFVSVALVIYGSQLF